LQCKGRLLSHSFEISARLAEKKTAAVTGKEADKPKKERNSMSLSL